MREDQEESERESARECEREGLSINNERKMEREKSNASIQIPGKENL